MRPVDFIGRVVTTENKQIVSQVEGTIFAYEDKLRGAAGWQGSFLKWKSEEALLSAHKAGGRLLLVCNDGRQGEITLEPEIVEWGLAGFRFKGMGSLSQPTTAPSWRNLDRMRSADGNPDPT